MSIKTFINQFSSSEHCVDIYIGQSERNFCKRWPITRRCLGMRQLGVRAPGSRTAVTRGIRS